MFRVWCLVLGVALPAFVASAATPEEVFRNPPREAHVGVWWHWMGSQVTEEGIRKDLDWFQQIGIFSATVFGMADSCTPWARRIGNVPTEGLRPYDERWWRLFAFACREGQKRGIDIGLHNCPGYTCTGGPWITPQLGMRELVCGVTDPKNISTRPNARFPVYDEDHRRYSHVPCEERRTDIVEIGVARGGIKVSHIPMGAFVQPADWDTFGLECDKMNPEAVDFHLDHVFAELHRHLGPDLGAAGLGHILLDSYEAGTPTWTPHMREEFKARRGYDPLEFLPILCGKTDLYTKEEVERFRKDFNRTVKDLYRDVLFKRMSERIHKEGLEFSNEPYEGPFETSEVAPFIDRLMTEFWYTPSGSKLFAESHKSFNRLQGPGGKRHNIIEAEAFTGAPENCEWTEMPANLKPAADDAFVSGVNRLIFHTATLQPWGDDVKPGVTMGRWGTHFGRNQTWAECGKPFFDYLARCQALLQWGEPSEKRLRLKDVREISRTDGDRTIHFIVNKISGESRFYDDKTEQWFDPVSGAIRNSYESELVVKQLADFEPEIGDRSQADDPAVRYYSGTLTYRTRFDLPKAGGTLALRFPNPADQVYVVRVNGRQAGTAWGSPWTVELPGAVLKEKGNELEIGVTNSWRNRLIGDEQEPADCEFENAPLGGGQFLLRYPDWFKDGIGARPSKGRKCFTTWNYFTKDSKLTPSGLIMPPMLVWKEK